MIESSVKIVMKVHVRWAIQRDMPEMVDIEARTHERAWAEEDFLRNLRQRNTIGMIAERRDRVLGYVIYTLHRDRIEVLRLAADPEFAGKGVGRQIVDKIKSKLSVNRRARIAIDMRETNMNGLLFLKNQGFLAVGMEREAFEDTGEDMIQMEYRITE